MTLCKLHNAPRGLGGAVRTLNARSPARARGIETQQHHTQNAEAHA